MNKSRVNNFLIINIFLALIPAILFSAPTEQSLIAAWENQQRNDPNTLVFENISPDIYHFKTERFPFDGELQILNVTVDEQIFGFDGSVIMGIIEPELLDLPEDFSRKYSYSYSSWLQNNILYYDKEEEKWLSAKEYYSKAKKTLPNSSFLDTMDYIPLLFLFFIILLLIFVYKIQRRNRLYLDHARELSQKETDLAEKTYQLSRNSNKLLKEILKELKKGNPKKKTKKKKK
jgi:hypothetical protein